MGGYLAALLRQEDVSSSGILSVGPPVSSFVPILQSYIGPNIGGVVTSHGDPILGGGGLTALYQTTDLGYSDAITGVAASTHNVGTKITTLGVEGDAYNIGAGDVQRLAGVVGYAEQDGSGTMIVMCSVECFPNVRSAGIVLENAGLWARQQNGRGNKNYGIMVEDQGIGADDWAILVKGGRTELDGDLVLGGGAPAVVTAGKVALGAAVSATASAGSGQATPATVSGFLLINVAGTVQKVPYYPA